MATKSYITNKKRVKTLFFIALALLAIIIIKLIDLMVIDAQALQEKAEGQWTREISVAPERGKIKDRNGEILAASASVESVVLYPKNIKNPGEVANLLAPILEMTYEDVHAAASDEKKVEVWLKRQITDEQSQAIKDKINGSDFEKQIGFFADIKRIYPYGSFMSQVIGYTTADGVGQEGLEKKYEKYLAGYAGTMLRQVDASGRTIDGSEQTYIDPQAGLDVCLTSDAVIQSFAESAVAEAMQVNKAASVSCIVMDPNNGDILAMANSPQLDINNLDRSDTAALAALSRNTSITDAFEPGSIYKIVTLAAALDSGTATLDSHYNCAGHKTVDGDKIKCWRSYNPHGNQTFTQAAENSCNPAFMDMALNMGTDKFYEYIEKFGFGSTTGVDYSSDAAGIVRAAKYVKNVDLARIGFGQSIAVTPLQMISAAAATINGGTLYTPRFVSYVADEQGNVVKEFQTNVKEQVISEQTSAQVRQVLASVVENGSGKNAQIAGYTVGGKTGTAQMYENGVIAQGKNISSFIGFAPADNPKYIVLFMVREPDVYVTFGSVVAAPYAKSILEKCLKYGGVAPSVAQEELIEVPNLMGQSPDAAKSAANSAGLSAIMNGTGEVVAQSPAAGTKVKKGTMIDMFGKDATYEVVAPIEVPNIMGDRLDIAFEKLHQAGLDLKIAGDLQNGYVATQSPAAGEELAYGSSVTVTCKETSE